MYLSKCSGYPVAVNTTIMCKKNAFNNGEIYFNGKSRHFDNATWMQLGHVGSYVFNGTMGALANLDYAAHGMDTKSRPHLVTKEEEDIVEQEAGRKLSRAERRKMARDKRKKR